MSKAPDKTTTTSQASLPDYISPYVNRFLPRAETVSTMPYQTYGGQRLAEFSQDTQDAFGKAREAAGMDPTGIMGAQQTAQGLSGYQAGNIGTGDWTTANQQGYMNPYIQNVLDVQKQRSQQKFLEDQQMRNAGAVQAGAFGGNRRFVQDSLAQRDLNQQLQEQEATGLQSAYDRAMQQYSTDAGRQLQAQMAQEQARQGAAGINLQGAQFGADLDSNLLKYRLDQAGALSDVGAKEQQREQAGLDLAYQDFQRQQNYPYEQLSKYMSLLYGNPIQSNVTQTEVTPAPDFLSQLIGVGTAGAGIWKLLNGGGA
jgi:hypothetical protein